MLPRLALLAVLTGMLAQQPPCTCVIRSRQRASVAPILLLRDWRWKVAVSGTEFELEINLENGNNIHVRKADWSWKSKNGITFVSRGYWRGKDCRCLHVQHREKSEKVSFISSENFVLAVFNFQFVIITQNWSKTKSWNLKMWSLGFYRQSFVHHINHNMLDNISVDDNDSL